MSSRASIATQMTETWDALHHAQAQESQLGGVVFSRATGVAGLMAGSDRSTLDSAHEGLTAGES
jgi:hypothetical protein